LKAKQFQIEIQGDTDVKTQSNIHALRQRDADLRGQAEVLHQKSVKENRAFSAEEQASWDSIAAQRATTKQQIDREVAFLDDERSAPGSDDPNTEAARRSGAPGAGDQGFKSLGEQLTAVVNASMGGGRSIDPRLIKAAASGASEAVPSDGGFLVQTDFSTNLLQRMYQDGEIVSRVTKYPISNNANRLKINAIDEDSRVDGSRWGGVQAFWANEADAFTASKPKLRQIELALEKLTGLCYATDELLQDATALEAVITDAFPKEFTFKVEDAIVNGTGAGQPLGILNSGAVIQVAKDSGDSGATISTNDVLNMWARLFATSRKNAVWLINQDVEPKLYPLTIGSGTAVQLLYTPPGTPSNPNPYGLLLGKPVIPTEHNATLGTPGDIVLGDLSQYVLIDKGAPSAASSIHVRFLNDEMTFRFIYRVDGQPTWKKPLTPKNGTATLSPFISLAARS
jgi:HK97 family phage major capsid protein